MAPPTEVREADGMPSPPRLCKRCRRRLIGWLRQYVPELVRSAGRDLEVQQLLSCLLLSKAPKQVRYFRRSTASQPPLPTALPEEAVDEATANVSLAQKVTPLFEDDNQESEVTDW